MPTRTPRGFTRYDASNPDDLKELVANGLIWRAGPKAKQVAIKALIEGSIPMPERLPDEVRTFIESRRNRA